MGCVGWSGGRWYRGGSFFGEWHFHVQHGGTHNHRLSGLRCAFPLFNQLHDITDIPEARLETRGHGRGHSHGAIHAGKVVLGRVQRDHVNVAFDFLGMAVGQAREPPRMLAHRLIVLLDIAG